jgi:hypothetical protein
MADGEERLGGTAVGEGWIEVGEERLLGAGIWSGSKFHQIRPD